MRVVMTDVPGAKTIVPAPAFERRPEKKWLSAAHKSRKRLPIFLEMVNGLSPILLRVTESIQQQKNLVQNFESVKA